MRAFCWSSGLIEFGQRTPAGAIAIAHGPAAVLREFVGGYARHGYKTRLVNGRPTKIPGSDHLLVPGVPEADLQLAAVDALTAWCQWIAEHAPKGVTVL